MIDIFFYRLPFPTEENAAIASAKVAIGFAKVAIGSAKVAIGSAKVAIGSAKAHTHKNTPKGRLIKNDRV